MIGTKWENVETFIIEYLHLILKITIYYIGKLFLFKKEKLNLFFWEFLKNRNCQDAFKRPLTEIRSKEKESTPSPIGAESIRVSTEVYYTNKIYPGPTLDELNNVGNA